jgi:hypothetical protein
METKELRKVQLSDIQEYSTRLGSRCVLLRELGLSAYRDSEEALKLTLEKSAEDISSLEICKKSSRCSAFWDAFQRGETPFLEKDKILLLEHNGKFLVEEGKHRACMAKRAGVETISAYIWPSYEDFTMLPPVGEAGIYHFYYCCNRKKPYMQHGEAFGLWVKTPHGTPPSRFDYRPTLINNIFEADSEWINIMESLSKRSSSIETTDWIGIMDGLSYKISVAGAADKLFGRNKYNYIKVEVHIEPNEAAKIWLFETEIGRMPQDIRMAYKMPLRKYKTLYRRGCFRAYDLEEGVRSIW